MVLSVNVMKTTTVMHRNGMYMKNSISYSQCNHPVIISLTNVGRAHHRHNHTAVIKHHHHVLSVATVQSVRKKSIQQSTHILLNPKIGLNFNFDRVFNFYFLFVLFLCVDQHTSRLPLSPSSNRSNNGSSSNNNNNNNNTNSNTNNTAEQSSQNDEVANNNQNGAANNNNQNGAANNNNPASIQDIVALMNNNPFALFAGLTLRMTSDGKCFTRSICPKAFNRQQIEGSKIIPNFFFHFFASFTKLGDPSGQRNVEMSVQVNGVTYDGVLFAQQQPAAIAALLPPTARDQPAESSSSSK